MSNPNNCKACSHFQNEPGGHCYMFRHEPTEPCMQHTVRFEAAQAARMEVFRLASMLRIRGKAAQVGSHE